MFQQIFIVIFDFLGRVCEKLISFIQKLVVLIVVVWFASSKSVKSATLRNPQLPRPHPGISLSNETTKQKLLSNMESLHSGFNENTLSQNTSRVKSNKPRSHILTQASQKQNRNSKKSQPLKALFVETDVIVTCPQDQPDPFDKIKYLSMDNEQLQKDFESYPDPRLREDLRDLRKNYVTKITTKEFENYIQNFGKTAKNFFNPFDTKNWSSKDRINVHSSSLVEYDNGFYTVNQIPATMNTNQFFQETACGNWMNKYLTRGSMNGKTIWIFEREMSFLGMDAKITRIRARSFMYYDDAHNTHFEVFPPKGSGQTCELLLNGLVRKKETLKSRSFSRK